MNSLITKLKNYNKWNITFVSSDEMDSHYRLDAFTGCFKKKSIQLNWMSVAVSRSFCGILQFDEMQLLGCIKLNGQLDTNSDYVSLQLFIQT